MGLLNALEDGHRPVLVQLSSLLREVNLCWSSADPALRPNWLNTPELESRGVLEAATCSDAGDSTHHQVAFSYLGVVQATAIHRQ